MPHSFHSLLIHAVFSTKNRVAHMDAELRSNLFPYMDGILREMGCSARLINGTADYVHLLIDLPADLSVAECMRVVKANSSRWIHERWPHRRTFAWQAGYGAFTVSASSEEAVFDYIRTQEEHHRRVSFQDEFVALLRKHRVAFDEKFLRDGSVARSTG
ncbi:MAG TPA: IS200/IS605 family transposase [Candidatus Acidoferrales bacterium]|jgi:REP element-mobilizing transposase RayT|nr:IS200/IS605 family transposase [Candidatus Acidoferrales bacterium]